VAPWRQGTPVTPIDGPGRDVARQRGEAYLQRLKEIASEAGNITEALYRTLSETTRAYVQNGEVVSAEAARWQVDQNAEAFADMEIEFVDTWYPDERVLILARANGRASRRFPLVRIGYRFEVRCAFLARINEDLSVSELHTYLNPGYATNFPSAGEHLTPPPADGATEEHARALYARWFAGAEAGRDFVSSVASAISPRGVVHFVNGDTGNAQSFERLFERISHALHDLTLELEEVTFDGPRVVAPFRMSGVHRGRLGIFMPTRKTLASTGLLLARANEAGEAAELWVYVAPAFALAIPPGIEERMRESQAGRRG